MGTQDKDIIEYFRNLDRSFFMDVDKNLAKWDRPLSIGHGQTISQPSLVLDMTLALDLQPDSKVLEIGTGSGYQTALLAKFSREVFTIERIEQLHERAKDRLKEAGFENVHLKLSDGSEGWSDHAPFDRIMATAAASSVPRELLDQLTDAGKMVIPVGGEGLQELRLIEKFGEGEYKSTVLEQVQFVRFKGKYD
ncbi:protein-L-isoaspartate(D-aspartate) O-methyltransferase [Evansella clarkii]|uniref:protein-L-isoaspartate(D-aspartate) O-methyltransferase n=1 Tax=Evansella clarkii TaxID=79879 RepID=UPI000996BFFE|nr:protein-L-isoaspartate(D-aspartate) O-methyltransferase [Evansella clarkii]